MSCRSVAECEAVTKKLYSLLGWEYKDEDSDDEPAGGPNPAAVNTDDDNDSAVMDCDDVPQSPCEDIASETDAPSSMIPDSPTLRPAYTQIINTQDSDKGETLLRDEASSSAIKRRAVVELTRLSEDEIRNALCSLTPGQYSSEEEDLSSCDSDNFWEPKDDSDDSDYSDFETKLKKTKETFKKTAEVKKGHPKKNATKASTYTNVSVADNTIKSQQNVNTDSIATQSKINIQTELPVKETFDATQRTNKVAALGFGAVVSSVCQAPTKQATGPPPGLSEEVVTVNMAVLAKRMSNKWQKGEIVAIPTKEDGELKYKVDFREDGTSLVSGHHMAFDRIPSLERLYVGARVVAKYKQTNQSTSFYSGVLGELPSRRNRMRFLVFLDDHTPCYLGLPSLHLVCRPLKNVWDDIPDCTHSHFIQDYLTVWPYPPLVEYRIGDEISAEFEGVQKKCDVKQIDCNLVHVIFQDDQHEEWIYRGSIRLQHLVNMKEHMKLVQKDEGSTLLTTHTNKSQDGSTSTHVPAKHTSPSTRKTGQAVVSRNATEQEVIIPTTAVVTYTPHECCPACLDQIRPYWDVKHCRGRNPMVIPQLFGFRRMIAPKCDKNKSKLLSHVYYRSPCGLSLSSIAAVQDYLYRTHCDFLFLEMFCLDPHVSVSTFLETLPPKIYIPDLAQGLENQQVSCINEHNNIRPPEVAYSSELVIKGDISTNNSLDFMPGCDCTDGCRDSVACSCRQLTIQATSLSPGGPVDASAGYNHKRLNGRIITGLYECSARCSCNPRMCSNRVVQHGIQLRLQVFMAPGRDWGIRCLDDVAKGTFVCAYSGRVICGEKNTHSATHFAKLNLIERVEIHKEDYEPKAYCSDSETAENLEESMEEEDNNAGNGREDPAETAACKGRKSGPAAKEKRPKESFNIATKATTRGFFDGEDLCYIIDAEMEGNVARYLSHDRSPNLFEQYVFVDTHDLRFPRLAFFTEKRLKAGTELTIDYRSIGGVGSISAAQQLCHSSSKKKRKKKTVQTVKEVQNVYF
ncbi:histone-lysine N-methyltransferase SETDB1-A [Lampris incognitus]|uniref:histone-lysine N-methyltransferase SETDB1-A n=1 Tax=Lampris incognitus TaxID=2546036 RepID=UPI0024B48C28|nr:histone-lysine N-methyltransferase SETDB1-A [Lampris incognitus]